MTKGLIYLEDRTINKYAPNIRAPKYMKQWEVKGEIHSNTILGDFNTLLPTAEGKLEISQICGRKLNVILLSKQWVKEEIRREIIKYLETNEIRR